MREMWNGFGDQLRRSFAERRYVILLFLLLGASWICMDVYRDLVVKDAPVAVLDFDNSSISRIILTHLSTARELRLVTPAPNSVEDAQDKLIRGELAAVVVIPSNLSSDLKKGRRASVLAAIDMSNILVGRNAYKAIRTIVATIGGGAQLTLVRKLGERKERVSAVVAPIVIDANFTFNPARNYVIYLIPGLLMFFLHVYVLILAASPYLVGEGRAAFGRRFGQAIGVWLVGLFLGWIFFYGLMRYVSIIPMASIGVVTLHLAIFLALDILLVATAMALIPNRLSALQAAILLGMLSLMFSGITWPTDMFPRWIAAVATVIPFTPFAKSFQMFLHYPVTLGETVGLLQGYAWQAIGFIGLTLGAVFVRGAWRRRKEAAA